MRFKVGPVVLQTAVSRRTAYDVVRRPARGWGEERCTSILVRVPSLFIARNRGGDDEQAEEAIAIGKMPGSKIENAVSLLAMKELLTGFIRGRAAPTIITDRPCRDAW